MAIDINTLLASMDPSLRKTVTDSAKPVQGNQSTALDRFIQSVKQGPVGQFTSGFFHPAEPSAFDGSDTNNPARSLGHDFGGGLAIGGAGEALSGGLNALTQVPGEVSKLLKSASVADETLPAIQGITDSPAVSAVDDVASGLKSAKPKSFELPSIEAEVPKGEPGQFRVSTKAGIGGAARDAIAQNAVDNIPGVSAAEKYSNMAKRMGQLGDQITAYNAANPVSTTSEVLRGDYLKSIDNLLAPEGMLESTAQSQGLIGQKTASQMADEFIQTLERKAGVQVSADPQTSLRTYSIDDLTKMKQQANSVLGDLLEKRYNDPSSLTLDEKIRLASRDALDKTITQIQPAIKQMTLEQSGLFDSAKPLQKLSLTEQAAADKAALAPKPTLLDRAKAHPLGALGLAGVGGFGIAKLPDIAGGLTAAAQNAFDSTNIQAAPEAAATIYKISNPTNDGSIMSDSDYAQQVGQLQQQIGATKISDPVKSAQLEGQLSSLQTRYNSQDKLRTLSNDSERVTSVANRAVQDLATADPGMINALNGGYDAMQTASNGKYAALATDLQTLGALADPPIDFTKTKNVATIKAVIDKLVKAQQEKIDAQSKQYTGGSTTVNALPPIQAPAPAPAQDWASMKQAPLPPIQ